MGAVGRIFETKENSMKWLKRLVVKWVRDDWEEQRDRPDEVMSVTKANRLFSTRDVDGEDGINIIVRKAMGGKIVTFRTYDHKTDRNNHKLYVIPDDHDFEKELGKLITLESMRM
jgi:hypothetical protein